MMVAFSQVALQAQNIWSFPRPEKSLKHYVASVIPISLRKGPRDSGRVSRHFLGGFTFCRVCTLVQLVVTPPFCSYLHNGSSHRLADGCVGKLVKNTFRK